MIEIVNAHNLKNITQIGTPAAEEEKVYIEDSVYTRIHVDEFRDKRVFVFVGHTECENGRYKTFIEGVIPVYDILFIDGIPVWNNRAWNEVFQEVKRDYSEFIIVGWAYDQQGIKPVATRELEAVHREHFGGIHQLLFLMDTTGGEEYFFLLRSNRLYRKAGFYIFYSSVKIPVPEPVEPVNLEVEWVKQDFSASKRVSLQPPRTKSEEYTAQRVSREVEDSEETTYTSRGYYRQLLQENQKSLPVRKKNPAAAAVVLFLLLGITGVAISKNEEAVRDIQTWISGTTIDSQMPSDTEPIVPNTQAVNEQAAVPATQDTSTETQAPSAEEQTSNTEKQAPSADTQPQESQVFEENVPEIPVEKVDGGIETRD